MCRTSRFQVKDSFFFFRLLDFGESFINCFVTFCSILFCSEHYSLKPKIRLPIFNAEEAENGLKCIYITDFIFEPSKVHHILLTYRQPTPSHTTHLCPLSILSMKNPPPSFPFPVSYNQSSSLPALYLHRLQAGTKRTFLLTYALAR